MTVFKRFRVRSARSNLRIVLFEFLSARARSRG